MKTLQILTSATPGTKSWYWQELHNEFDNADPYAPQRSVHAVLSKRLTSLLETDEPRIFQWSHNSCHVDTWLVVQLAFYTYSQYNSPGPSANWPDAYRKVFRVLSCVGEFTLVGPNRDLYLEYELHQQKRKSKDRVLYTGDDGLHSEI
jgi:hypothetical protein